MGKLKAPHKNSPKPSIDVLIHTLISKVDACLCLDGSHSINVDAAFKDACIRREILAMVKEGSIHGTDSVQILTSRIQSLLSNSNKCNRGKKNKREELRLSKLDEWYLVQQYLVQEERESTKKMAQKRAEERATFQNEHRRLLEEIKKRGMDKKRKKVEELRMVQECVRKAARDVAEEMEVRKLAGQRLRQEREEQIELERKKREILEGLCRLVDENEKHDILNSIRNESQASQEQKRKARAELEFVLHENKKSQRQKLDKARAEREENKRCMEEYSRMLSKQEEQRKMNFLRIQEIQKVQESTNARHALHSKRWVDDDVVARQASELEKKQAERDKLRFEQKHKNKIDLITTLDAQIQEKHAKRAKEMEKKSAEKDNVVATNAKSKQIMDRELQMAADARMKLKHGLDVQIMQQKRSILANKGMNHSEKALNSKMLQQLELKNTRS